MQGQASIMWKYYTSLLDLLTKVAGHVIIARNCREFLFRVHCFASGSGFQSAHWKFEKSMIRRLLTTRSMLQLPAINTTSSFRSIVLKLGDREKKFGVDGSKFSGFIPPCK
ncbi:MAG: hypothetical protein MHMPM18_004155 [Marteilia pararefringens]